MTSRTSTSLAELSWEAGEMREQPVLSVHNFSKSFGATKALYDVDLDLYAGEILGLVGDNGAGKSTLVKAIDGVFPADSGTLTYRGEPRKFSNALSARLAGIETVHQDLALCDNLTVYQNIFLGRELKQTVGPMAFLAKMSMRREAGRIIEERLGVAAFPIEKRTGQLSGGQRQLVALARAVAWQAHVLLFDEPTAALSPQAVGHVEEVIRRLKDSGVAVLIITHNLPQVIKLTDRIAVLRQGRNVATLATEKVTPQLLLGLITGMISRDEVQEANS